ncbi:YeaC family protein [Motiliproteus sp. SC1-56]|uniref:YeaC family protein n=1 Tax=Motiliproteus sp. SC1-56 TaxID=2799565 RepID=UPI001A90B6D6|nr:DUF1315 family protein [Motiliproteus sp. SC1-56]
MTFEELLESMTPEIHAAMKQAVELGKWPNGQRLGEEERKACLQAVIAYDAKHLPEEERVGFIDRTKADGSQHGPNKNAEDIIKILNH